MSLPTTGMDETSPSGSQAISLGDDRIREYKTQNREVLEVDHVYPSSGQSATAGYHKQVTLVEAANIGTGATGLPILGAQTVSGKPELTYTDEDNNDIQLTNQGTPIAISALTAKTTPVLADALILNDSADSNKSKQITLTNLLKLMYPVGTVLTFGVSTNPNTLFGFGTWTAIAGRVIVGLDAGQTEFDVLNETGGAKTHTMTLAELIEHTHTESQFTASGPSPEPAASIGGGGNAYHNQSANTGATGSASPTPFNILNPYIVKYVWERTA